MQRIDVVLSIGNASLTITDHRDVALAHWSLAAIERLNPGQRPALYAPGTDAAEQVETGDEAMIRAIEKVRTAVDPGRPHPGRLRSRLVLITALLLLGAGLVWLPEALVRTTAKIVPDAVRLDIGSKLYAEITRRTGRACSSRHGQAALGRLIDVLAPHGPEDARVLPSGPPAALYLPGGMVLLNRGIVEDHESALVPAGALLAEADKAAQTDPLVPLLRELGLVATVQIMTSGGLPEDSLGGYAEKLLTEPPGTPNVSSLSDRFRATGISSAPYAYAIDITGETTLSLIEADVTPASGRMLLSDGEWVALQGICFD